MERTRAERRTNIFDYWNPFKKVKLTNINTQSKRQISCFSDLSNELIYEIFEYLDFYDAYRSFFNLNKRFHNFFINSNVPIEINLSSMSRTDFQPYCREIILSNRHRIKLLRISNPFLVDLIFSPVKIISKFVQLQTLILENMTSKYLKNILQHLTKIPNLHSFQIDLVDPKFSNQNLYELTFKLPQLKYCQISTSESLRLYNYPSMLDGHSMSTIEHLVIKQTVYLDALGNLLSRVPKIRHLSLPHLFGTFSGILINPLIVLNNLKSIDLNMKYVSFDQFELFFRNLSSQLEVLHIFTNDDRSYLNANRWQQLIISSFPKLRIFDIEYHEDIQNNTNNQQSMFDSIIGQFSTQFWYNHHWNFGYYFYILSNRKKVVFFSRDPFRRKHHTLHERIHQLDRLHLQRANMNSVKDLNVECSKALTNSINYFPNVKSLTLSYNTELDDFCFGRLPSHVICLKHLSALNINCCNFKFQQLLEILCQTINLQKLMYSGHVIDSIGLLSHEQKEVFQYIADRNKIKHLVFERYYSLDHLKLIFLLFSRIQQLTISNYFIFNNRIEDIVKFVLLESRSNLTRLSLLSFIKTWKKETAQLKCLIKSEGLLDNYCIKSIDSKLYLWW